MMGFIHTLPLFARWLFRQFIAYLKSSGRATGFSKFWMQFFLVLAVIATIFKLWVALIISLAAAGLFWLHKAYVAGDWRALAKEDFLKRRPPKIIAMV